MTYLLLVTLIGGLLMYLLCTNNAKASEIGRMLFFAAVLGLMIAYGPVTMRLLHGG